MPKVTKSNTNLLLKYINKHPLNHELIIDIINNGCDINETNDDNVSILNLYINSFKSINCGKSDKINIEIVKLLTPDNINSQCKKGYTILHAVCKICPNRLDIIKYLVEECDIDITIKNSFNNTGLDLIPINSFGNNSSANYLKNQMKLKKNKLRSINNKIEKLLAEKEKLLADENEC